MWRAAKTKCRPRSMAIDSGTIARSGDGSTAPSGSLDGVHMRQVGECGTAYLQPGSIEIGRQIAGHT